VARREWTLGIDYPEKRWYSDPDLVITVFPSDSDYAIAVELVRPSDGPPFATGVAVRRVHMLSGPLEEPTDVSPRDVQRLPLAAIVRAALAAAATAPEEPPAGGRGEAIRGRVGYIVYDPGDERREKYQDVPWVEEARKILVPRGRPKHGKSTAYYRDLAGSYRELAKAGYSSPVKEIARRKQVSENTVHQWIHRARHLGFLEPSSRSKRPPQAEKEGD